MKALRTVWSGPSRPYMPEDMFSHVVFYSPKQYIATNLIEYPQFVLEKKLEMCPQYTGAPAMGYMTIKPQNSAWYKCLNLSLTGSGMYICTYICTYTQLYRRAYIHMHVPTYGKPKKLYAPGVVRCGVIKSKMYPVTIFSICIWTESPVKIVQMQIRHHRMCQLSDKQLGYLNTLPYLR